MNLKSPLLKVLSGKNIKPNPIWMMRQAGRHLPEYRAVRESTNNFIEFCFTPEKAAEVTLQPIRRYDMDAAILFADILLIPKALGRDVTFRKGVGPILKPMEVSDIKDLRLNGASDRLSPIYETVSRVKKELNANKALIGFAGGPWTVATYMLEGRGSPNKEVAKRFAYNNPEATDDLLSILAESSADYLIEQARAGADVLKIFESWAEGLSPALFDRLVIKPTNQIISLIRAAGIEVPIIGFPRGAGLNTVRYTQQTGITCIALGTAVPMKEMRALLPEGIPTQGNLDPLVLRVGGEALRSAVQNTLDSIEGPHIFNLGHGVSPDVKIENVHAVISHLRSGDGNYV